MNVKTLCLAILQQGDATGYEIKKMSVEGEYSYFVDASFGSIYPALARLEADGYVTVREETHPGKPARKVYSITEEGRAALIAELSGETDPDIFRSPFLLVAMNARLLPRELIARAIDTRIQQLEAELKSLHDLAEVCGPGGAGWIARYGCNCMTASLEFLNAHRGELESITADADAPDGQRAAG